MSAIGEEKMWEVFPNKTLKNGNCFEKNGSIQTSPKKERLKIVISFYKITVKNWDLLKKNAPYLNKKPLKNGLLKITVTNGEFLVLKTLENGHLL